MIVTKEHLAQEIDDLDAQQLNEIADFIAFIKFKARYPHLSLTESQLSALYAEFADEDKQLAEEGTAEYTDSLKEEDAL